MSEPTLYLFDGYNILHAGGFRGPAELVDRLADFVALKGARGVVVFDGGGEDRTVGRLEVRHASHADALLERLAAEHRLTERVCLVSSDATLRGTAGREVEQRSSSRFLADVEAPSHSRGSSSRLGDRVDDETRAALERLRRGEEP
jgi:predicted RNA-binding protein with PIN domain